MLGCSRCMKNGDLDSRAMELSRIMELAQALAEESDQVELYPQYGRLVILRNIGKILGACDRQYVDFLCLSNGMRAFGH